MFVDAAASIAKQVSKPVGAITEIVIGHDVCVDTRIHSGSLRNCTGWIDKRIAEDDDSLFED